MKPNAESYTQEEIQSQIQEAKKSSVLIKFRVWWIPQVPMNPFYVDVSGPKEAKKILEVLANYDIFQFENKVKPDYCNAGGLVEWNEEDQEWYEWEDGEGNNIDDWNP